uniref:Uncharacterized protein n=1 Tax=Mesocestoides corti TaxID=53468 RepID=A0A5K3FWK0_MESCO
MVNFVAKTSLPNVGPRPIVTGSHPSESDTKTIKGLLESSGACIRELSDTIPEQPPTPNTGLYLKSLLHGALSWHLSLFNFYDRILQQLLNHRPDDAPDSG